MNISNKKIILVTIVLLFYTFVHIESLAYWEIKDSIRIMFDIVSNGKKNYASYNGLKFYVNNKKEILCVGNLVKDNIIISPLILRSIDTGNSYTRVYPLSIPNQNQGQYLFVNDSIGFFAIFRSQKNNIYPFLSLFRTTNSGRDWYMVFDSMCTEKKFRLELFDKTKILLFAHKNFYLSDNLGLLWTKDSSFNILNNYPLFIYPNSMVVYTSSPLECLGTHTDINIEDNSFTLYLLKYKKPVLTINNEIIDYLSLSISPNPVTEKLTLINIRDNATEYEVYDQFGNRQIAELISGQIDVSLLPAGVYFLKLNNSQRPLKFLKI